MAHEEAGDVRADRRDGRELVTTFEQDARQGGSLKMVAAVAMLVVAKARRIKDDDRNENGYIELATEKGVLGSARFASPI